MVAKESGQHCRKLLIGFAAVDALDPTHAVKVLQAAP